METVSGIDARAIDKRTIKRVVLNCQFGNQAKRMEAVEMLKFMNKHVIDVGFFNIAEYVGVNPHRLNCRWAMICKEPWFFNNFVNIIHANWCNNRITSHAQDSFWHAAEDWFNICIASDGY